jgi:hypothetical protein
MKQFVFGFGQFVNEMFDQNEGLEKKSSCCGATLMEDGSCSECGAFEAENDEEKESLNVNEKAEKTRKEVLKAAQKKFPNISKAGAKAGLGKMKGKDFKEKAKKNFGWAEDPEAAAAAYIRKATGKEPRDV